MTVAARLPDHVHPLLAALRDDPGGEAAFWDRMARERTPLIAPDPATPGHSIVTFVYRAPAGAGHVVLMPGFGAPPDHVMAEIPGTSVRHASYRFRDDVRTAYSFAPDLPPVRYEDAGEADWKAYLAFLREHPPQPDPHHREHIASRMNEGEPDHVQSFVSLPDAPDQSLIQKRPGIARGWIDAHTFRSETMDNERRVWVYTPPGYKDGAGSYPVLVLFDGGAALSRQAAQRTLDNLLAEGRIRPLVAVFVDNPTDTSRNDELPCNETFARFIEAELLPWLRGAYRVSNDPADHFVTGASYGGLASMWLGYRLPHVFGNVISQAASLWWGPGCDLERPAGARTYTPEWLIEQYAASPRLPVRFWMEIGLMEHPDRMIAPNRRMKALLEAKGYDLTYSEPCGGHDYILWRGTLASALTTMLPA